MSHGSEHLWVEGGAKLASDKFTRNHMMRIDQVRKFRDRFRNRGVFTTIYRYDNPIQKEATLFAPFYMDLDGADWETVKADSLRALTIMKALWGIDQRTDLLLYFSGKKGIHILVPTEVMGVFPHKDLHEVYRNMAVMLHGQMPGHSGDPKVYDRVRMFRLVNSEHQDTGLFKVQITYDELVNLSYDQIKELAAEPRTLPVTPPARNSKAESIFQGFVIQTEKALVERMKGDKRFERKLDFDPPCLAYILENGAMQGERNQTAAVVCNHFKQRGYTEEKAWKLLTEWNELCSPPMTNRELETTLRSIWTNEYRWGCRTLEKLGPCPPEKCKLASKG